MDMMHPDDWRALVRDRMAEERARGDLWRLARSAARRTSLRALTARTLFRMAFAVEAEETWRALWESLASGDRVSRKSRGMA